VLAVVTGLCTLKRPAACRRAKKYAARDAERWAEYQWRDKGLLVVVLYAFRGPDNVIEVNA
jgi:hypothetical protein